MVCAVWLGAQLTKNITDGHNVVDQKFNNMDACKARLHIVHPFSLFEYENQVRMRLAYDYLGFKYTTVLNSVNACIIMFKIASKFY